MRSTLFALALVLTVSTMGCKDEEIEKAKQATEAAADTAADLGDQAVETAKEANQALVEKREKLAGRITESAKKLDEVLAEKKVVIKLLSEAKTAEAKQAANEALDLLAPKLGAVEKEIRQLEEEAGERWQDLRQSHDEESPDSP